MDRKRVLITGGILTIFGLLVYFQFRHWRKLRLDYFLGGDRADKTLAHRPRRRSYICRLRVPGDPLENLPAPGAPPSILAGTGAPHAYWIHGIGVAGTSGRVIRPYLIARRQKLPVSSQVAVWAVERIFDIGAFAVLMAVGIFLPSSRKTLPHPEYYTRFRNGGFLFFGLSLH